MCCEEQWTHPHASTLLALDPGTQHQLVGNSLLMPAVTAFVLFMLSRLQCVEEAEPLADIAALETVEVCSSDTEDEEGEP